MSLVKYFGIFLLTVILGLFLFIGKSNAQMMGNFNNQQTITPTQQDLQDIQTGKDLFTKFQNKQVFCANLKDDDFEKIGEYLMQQSFGNNTNAHLQMNTNMKQMIGEQGEEQMHIRLAKNATGCYTNAQGGVGGMMGNWGWSGTMMGGSWLGAFGFFAGLFWIAGFIDLILLGVWLWKQIRKR